MNVLHISAECYPAAKAGGLGDVAGALPKYLNEAGFSAAVIIPKYHTKWILNHRWETRLEGSFHLGQERIRYTIQELVDHDLGFPLLVADIPGKYDRPSVYLDETGKGFWDEVERSLCFQQAALYWVQQMDVLPEVLHCHDHHTGLIPFFVQHCPAFYRLKSIPTIFTIHNAEYHGAFGWERAYKLPMFDSRKGGLIEWDQAINPLAAAVKNAWKLTTVSPTYMNELREHAGNLAPLLQAESAKSSGILNGIDVGVWDPKKDAYLAHTLGRSWNTFKQKNRQALSDRFRLHDRLPLVTFIGRLAGEKGAYLLAPAIEQFLERGQLASFIILGTGEPQVHTQLKSLQERYPSYVNVALEYNEGLAHQLYAGSDFLWMPSKVEPCGLNQMYAMRYGTIPIVRATGGLRDTVVDISEADGRGIQFQELSIGDARYGLERAAQLYKQPKQFQAVRDTVTQVDFSWENSAQQYIHLYESVLAVVA